MKATFGPGARSAGVLCVSGVTVSTRTLRSYEFRGLLPEHRAGNGYRVYDEDDLRLVRQIRTLQDFGFDLEETRPFVECLRVGHPAGDSCPASLAVYRRKLAELDTLIDELKAVRERVGAQLVRAEAELPGGPAPRCELGDAVGGREDDGTRG